MQKTGEQEEVKELCSAALQLAQDSRALTLEQQASVCHAAAEMYLLMDALDIAHALLTRALQLSSKRGSQPTTQHASVSCLLAQVRSNPTDQPHKVSCDLVARTPSSLTLVGCPRSFCRTGLKQA